MPEGPLAEADCGREPYGARACGEEHVLAIHLQAGDLAEGGELSLPFRRGARRLGADHADLDVARVALRDCVRAL